MNKLKLTESFIGLFPVRFTNRCVQNLNCETLFDVLLITESVWINQRNLGKKTIKEVNNILQDYDLHLGMSLPELMGYDQDIYAKYKDQYNSMIQHRINVLKREIEVLTTSLL